MPPSPSPSEARSLYRPTPDERLPDDAWASEQAKSAGFIERQARNSFRDLCRVYGFGGARQIIAEIINDEAERKADV